MNFIRTIFVATLLELCWCNFTFAENNPESDSIKTQVSFGGYIKTDFLFTNYNDGRPSEASPINDVHFISDIPVGSDVNYSSTHFHAKESRFNLELNSDFAGKPVKAFAEIDFLMSVQGNPIISNSYNPRLRHAFVSYRNFTIGQTWTTFMTGPLPENLDLWGSPEGIILIRQPIIRYSTGNWHFAIENPYTTFTPFQGGPSFSSKGVIPDVVIRKDFVLSSGKISLAAVGRSLTYDNDIGDRFSTTGYGISAGGNIGLGKKDEVRFMATYGQGLGRYIALGFLTSSALDANGDPNTISSMNGYVALLHEWNEKWMTSLNGSMIMADNNTKYSGSEINSLAFSGAINLLYLPVSRLMTGIELRYGYRELENQVNGDFYRIQFSCKYQISNH